MKFKEKGIYSAILQIGYIAVLLIVIRLTSVVITFEGIAAILISIAINYIAMYMILKSMEKDEVNISIAMKDTAKKLVLALMPIYIIAVIFTFASFANLSSFGASLVWGIIVFYVYNIVFTGTLLSKEKK